MLEKDKEYYNQKIGELYLIIENQEKIIRDIQERNSNAIDYIEENSPNLSNSELYDLLEILKGGNNE